jgi:hypothetical protein
MQGEWKTDAIALERARIRGQVRQLEKLAEMTD